MPIPRWVARLNRRFINPRERARGKWPVLIHTGRTSGRGYETPLDAVPIEGGYLFFVIYGPRSDWVRNVVASGAAALRIHGEVVALTNPRLIDRTEAIALAPKTTKFPPGVLKVELFLRVDVAGVVDDPQPA